MRKQGFGVSILSTLFLFSLKVWSAGLCSGDEKAYFSCRIKSSTKTASLCGSKNLTPTQGYLQYRFGVPEKVEMEFPKEKQNSQKSFRYAHYFRAQDDHTEFSFDNNGHTYTLYSDYNGET